MATLNTPAEQIAALLHDVIADSDLTLEDFRSREYDHKVVDAIDLSRCAKKSRSMNSSRALLKSGRTEREIADLANNLDVRNWQEIGEPERERRMRYRRAWETLVAIDRERNG